MIIVPAIPMIAILEQYAYANKLPFIKTNWESIKRTLDHYNKVAQKLN